MKLQRAPSTFRRSVVRVACARPRRERLTRVARPLRDASSDALVTSLRPASLASPGPFSLHALFSVRCLGSRIRILDRRLSSDARCFLGDIDFALASSVGRW